MKIDRTLWLKLQQPFDRLLGLEGDQREAALMALELDEEERQVLRSLLQASDQSADMNISAPRRLKLDDSPIEMDWSGQLLGSWKVLSLLARGGMGMVYLGERADGEFTKQVAIKVLDVALQGNSQRLREEIRILARLEHPAIARLIDSGTTDQGDAWLVMELVEGLIATDYFAQNPASIRKRVETIISIAEALDYAHQRRVIHCDIKPDNVLIRQDGRPCLVDFGISSLVARPDDSEPVRRHKYYSRHYSAPERLSGVPPETPQDIYSLGALMQRLLREEGDDLPADLKAIIARAMADNPTDRYSSMTDFKFDLAAWIQRRPVLAREGGHGYILGRWLKRNALTASLFGLLLASLISGLVVSLNQTSIARAETVRANAVKSMLVDIFTSADPAQEDGDDPPASELLRRGAERIPVDLADQPEIQAELLQIIGYSQLERGQHEAAAATMDFTLSLLDQLPAQPNHPNVLADRAMVHYEQGELDDSIARLVQARELIQQRYPKHEDRTLVATRLADMYLVIGRYEDAVNLSQEVLDETNVPITTQIYASRVLGGVLERMGQFEQADIALQSAIDLQLVHAPDDIFLATIMNDLSILRYQENKLDEARGILQEVIELQSRVYGDTHPRVLTSIGNLASTETALGEYASSANRYEQILRALQTRHGDSVHSSKAFYQGQLAISLYLNGQLQAAYSQAVQARDEMLRMDEENRFELLWVEPVLGLLAMESRLVEHEPLIDLFDRECGLLDDESRIRRRLCIAKTIRQIETKGGCDSDVQVPMLSEEGMPSLNEEWQSAYRWLQVQCSVETNDVSSINLPAWLADRS